jgi:indole-3-glycerol phosphate synthase
VTDILEKIVSRKREEVAGARRRVPFAAIRALAEESRASTRNFAGSIRSRVSVGQSAVIAEIKKASPSRGLIRTNFDPVQIARSYEEAGAACLSVLTDALFFQGRPEDLQAARAACSLPVLRKDFLVDPYQVYEARAMGADCILLIAACLDDGLLHEMEDIAHALGMTVLPEVHDRPELERVLELRTPFVGINNRDLRTFNVSLSVTLDMLAEIPPRKIVVTESGISSSADVGLMRRSGVRAFLVGEALLAFDDPGCGLNATFGLDEAPQEESFGP